MPPSNIDLLRNGGTIGCFGECENLVCQLRPRTLAAVSAKAHLLLDWPGFFCLKASHDCPCILSKSHLEQQSRCCFIFDEMLVLLFCCMTSTHPHVQSCRQSLDS